MLALIKNKFYYSNGGLYYKETYSSGAIKGDRVGCIHKNGYRRVFLNNRLHSEHRLIWILHFGDIPKGYIIDHINRIRDDNNIDNLRLVSYKENQYNKEALGISFCKRTNKWFASIKLERKSYFLGRYDNIIDARASYLNAKKNLHIICGINVPQKEGNGL